MAKENNEKNEEEVKMIKQYVLEPPRAILTGPASFQMIYTAPLAMKGLPKRLRTHVDGVTFSVPCQKFKKSWEENNHDLYMSCFRINRPVDVHDATMQVTSYSEDHHNKRPDIVCPRREIPVPNDDAVSHNRLVWQAFTNNMSRSIESEYVKFKDVDPACPTIVFILETPDYDAKIAGRPCLMGSGDILGHWRRRHNAIQIDNNLFIVVINQYIAPGTEYKFVFHNIPNEAKQDSVFPPVSTDLPGNTCYKNFRWELPAEDNSNRFFDVEAKPNEIHYLSHYWGKMPKEARSSNWYGCMAVNTKKMAKIERKSKKLSAIQGSEIVGDPFGRAVFSQADIRDLETANFLENYILRKKKDMDLSRPLYVFLIDTPCVDLNIWGVSMIGSNDMFGNWKDPHWVAKAVDENLFVVIVNTEIETDTEYKWIMYKKALLKDQEAMLQQMMWEPPILQNRVFKPVDMQVNWNKRFVVFKQKWGRLKHHDSYVFEWADMYMTKLPGKTVKGEDVFCPDDLAKHIGNDLYDQIARGNGEKLLDSIDAGIARLESKEKYIEESKNEQDGQQENCNDATSHLDSSNDSNNTDSAHSEESECPLPIEVDIDVVKSAHTRNEENGAHEEHQISSDETDKGMEQMNPVSDNQKNEHGNCSENEAPVAMIINNPVLHAICNTGDTLSEQKESNECRMQSHSDVDSLNKNVTVINEANEVSDIPENLGCEANIEPSSEIRSDNEKKQMDGDQDDNPEIGNGMIDLSEVPALYPPCDAIDIYQLSNTGETASLPAFANINHVTHEAGDEANIPDDSGEPDANVKPPSEHGSDLDYLIDFSDDSEDGHSGIVECPPIFCETKASNPDIDTYSEHQEHHDCQLPSVMEAVHFVRFHSDNNFAQGQMLGLTDTVAATQPGVNESSALASNVSQGVPATRRRRRFPRFAVVLSRPFRRLGRQMRRIFARNDGNRSMN